MLKFASVMAFLFHKSKNHAKENAKHDQHGLRISAS